MKRLFTLLLFLPLLAAAQKKNIQPSQLPEGALEFIQSNFSNIALHHCYKFTDDNRDRFKAVMADDTEIEFSETGEWTEVDGNGHAVPSAYLPKPIITYLKANYPGLRIKKAEKEKGTIEVELVDGREIRFDKDGKFLGAEK